MDGGQLRMTNLSGPGTRAIHTDVLFPTNNTYDIGASGASSPRSIYFGTSLFRGATKVIGAQGAAVADASGGATIDAEARTAINALLARLRAHGLIAT